MTLSSPYARNRVLAWFDERVGLGAAVDFLRHKTVPLHRYSVLYYLGGVSLFLFAVQVGTGLLLLIYYHPTPDGAFESVRFIVAQVPFGWLIRSLHSWSANLMVFTVFLHMFSVYFMKAYAPPRELTWLSGMALLGLTMAFGFSGYLLPWNELAFFATKVGTDIVGSLPGIGHTLIRYLRGGEDVSGATLTRFFGWHVALLPALFTAVLVVHLLLVQRLGMHEPQNASTRGRMPFYPGFLFRDAMLWLGVLAVLLGLCTFLPWELGVKADPFTSAPAGIRPEWYFTFLSQSFKYVPARVLGFEGEVVAIVVVGLGGAIFLLVPFLDRWSARGKPSPLFSLFGVLALLYMAALTLLAYVKPY
jgi:quinol-cytochrome oxidoreductase complex cytochrome b subunit